MKIKGDDELKCILVCSWTIPGYAKSHDEQDQTMDECCGWIIRQYKKQNCCQWYG
jgi:hypothetical protein